MSSKTTPKPLTILFFSLDAAGHLSACVGMAQALMKRGHAVKILLNESFAGQYGKYGFEEIHLKRIVNGSQEKASAKNPFKKIAEQLFQEKVGWKSPLELLRERKEKKEVPPAIVDTIDNLIGFDPQIAEIIVREKADVIILDHFFVPPALSRSGVPWISLVSGNPLELYQSDKLPPNGSGYATGSDPATWQEYVELSKEISMMSKMKERFYSQLNYSPSPEEVERQKGGFTGKSTVLNIYGYPEELDYQDIVPIPDKFARVDAFCLESPDVFKLPEEFVVSPGDKLVYVSLGSMGSVDVNLMKKITEILNKSQHKFIVSKGPRADQYDLPPNCWGEAFLPQTRILSLVDLVITHGGNNTVTESVTFGKPMIVFPLFGDQYDNAQRVDEKGYGIRLDTNGFTEMELLNAIDQLLHDEKLIQRCMNAGERIRKSNSKEIVCKKIEQAVLDFKNNNSN